MGDVAMSLYDYNREVYVKSVDLVGIVTERGYRNGHSWYVVEFDKGNDYMTGGSDLRAHDYYCDGCGKSRRGQPHSRHEEAGWFCFLCVGPPAEREHDRTYRLMLEAESAEEQLRQSMEDEREVVG